MERVNNQDIITSAEECLDLISVPNLFHARVKSSKGLGTSDHIFGYSLWLIDYFIYYIDFLNNLSIFSTWTLNSVIGDWYKSCDILSKIEIMEFTSQYELLKFITLIIYKKETFFYSSNKSNIQNVPNIWANPPIEAQKHVTKISILQNLKNC